VGFRHPALAVALLAAAGLLLRAWVAGAVQPVKLQGDEWYYARVAAEIARGDGHHQGDAHALRPPLHAFALSLVIDPVNPRGTRSLNRLIALQIALGTALVVVTALLSHALFDARTGVAAAAIVAFDPTLVAVGHYLWSESLFALLVTAALALAVSAERRGTPVHAAAAGLAFGLAALTRELAVVAVAACAAWWVAASPAAGRRRAARRAAVLIGAALLVVAPWTLRNQRVLGQPVPISTVGWFTLAEGNTLPEPDWLAGRGPAHRELKRRYLAIPGELRRAAFARAWALERIREAQPLWLPRKLVRTVGLLASPDSVVFDKLRDARYPELPPAAVRSAVVLVGLAWPLLLAGAVCGIAGAPDRRRRLLPVLLFAGVGAVHVVANATARFRVPWLPLFAVYAGFALAHRGEVAARLGGRAGAAALLVLALVLGIGVPYFFAYQDPAAAWNAGR
jgi:4-amino-4-deoxy-L-arabinose transferase-like glycosyltransferase